jgi:hypothetical protein
MATFEATSHTQHPNTLHMTRKTSSQHSFCLHIVHNPASSAHYHTAVLPKANHHNVDQMCSALLSVVREAKSNHSCVVYRLGD